MAQVTGGVAMTHSHHGAARGVESVPPLPAWPVLALLWGLPVWWVLGLFPLSSVIVSIPMVAYLLLRRGTVLVPGVLPYFALLAWMTLSVLMLDGGLLGYATRYAQLASVGVILLYVVNAREKLTLDRVLAGLTAVWVTVVLGGYLGMFFPDLRLTTTVGALLPQGLSSHPYISDLLFPASAEIQEPWGAPEPFVRPSAPFAYANGWGASMAVLTPVVVGFAARRATVRSYLLLALAVAAAAPPALQSTNRGMFLGLGVVIGYVMARLFLRGLLLGPVLVLLGSLAAMALGGWRALSEILSARQEVVDTTEGRGNLYQEAFERTLNSPLVGYGSPRPSYWSEITVGTQGHVWNMMFCFGFVGLLLFLWFAVGAIVRTLHTPTTAGLWLHSVFVTTVAISVFYGLDRHLTFLAVLLGVMLRDRYSRSSLWAPRQEEG